MFRFKSLIVLILVVVIGYFIYMRTMGGGAGGQMAGMPHDMAMPVSVAEVTEREIQEWSEFSGRLVAVDQVEIRPRVSGTIDSIHFADGDYVKKGAVLFTIDPRPYEAAYQAASARAILTETELRRAERLLADKAVPQRDFDQRKNDARIARADLTRAKLDLGYTKILAPIEGRVSRAEITVGNLVDAGGNAPILTTVVSNRPIYADFEIDEKTYLRYTRGANGESQAVSQIPVTMNLATEIGAPHIGRIESFDNQLNPASGTIRVRAIFENTDGALVPGLFARIKLGSPTQTRALLITDRAVGTDQSKKFVLVVGNDNKVEYREVKLGAMADGLRVVQSGLKAGEKIVVNGLQRARPGSAVMPEMVPMDDKKPAAAPATAPVESHAEPVPSDIPTIPVAEPPPATPAIPAEPSKMQEPSAPPPGLQEPAAKE